MDLSVALTAFLLIAGVELPDKTFIATLVLASRYRPLAAWIGVGLAFAVHCLIAVSFGGLLTRLPHRPVTFGAFSGRWAPASCWPSQVSRRWSAGPC